MSCINPFTVTIHPTFSPKRNITVGCGYCLNCLQTRVSQIDFLSHRELLTRYKRGESASFCTFTYSDEHIPMTDSGFQTLRRDDVKLFLKRIRRNIDYEYRMNPSYAPKFKVLYCGEYGGQRGRPHYHIVFFGLSASQVEKYARKSWQKGVWDVQPAGNGCIRYVCKYLMKSHPSKEIKQFYDDNGVEKPFFYHSIGLGKEWIEQNIQKIVDDEFTFISYGKKRLFPKYVLRYVSHKTGIPYQPYVQRFISSSRSVVDFRNSDFSSFDEYDFEQSLLRYKSSIARLRQKGESVDDITVMKTFKHPYVRFNVKRLVSAINSLSLARDFNKFGDVVPF